MIPISKAKEKIRTGDRVIIRNQRKHLIWKGIVDWIGECGFNIIPEGVSTESHEGFPWDSSSEIEILDDSRGTFSGGTRVNQPYRTTIDFSTNPPTIGHSDTSYHLLYPDSAYLNPDYQPLTFRSLTKTTMSNIMEFFHNIAASKEEKLLLKHGIENPLGVPTENGLRLSAEVSYKANRAEIMKLVEVMEEEEKASKK